MSVVLDASAVLALLLREPGFEQVIEALGDAAISTVNLAEVCAKYEERGLEPALVAPFLVQSGVVIVPFQTRHALMSGQLRSVTKPFGLSLGDRACLATAVVERRSVLTADQAWLNVDLGIEILAIR